jgi:hypothetical protein
MLKAHFFAQGDKKIKGVDIFETFSPVANWQTTHIMLILSIIYGCATEQVDYIAVFIHSEIDNPPTWETMSAEQRT